MKTSGLEKCGFRFLGYYLPLLGFRVYLGAFLFLSLLSEFLHELLVGTDDFLALQVDEVLLIGCIE